jgi:hypothetical protein
MKTLRSWRTAGFALITVALALAACQSSNPSVPTTIPTASRTFTPSLNPSAPVAPSPTLRPLIEATDVPPTAGPVVDTPPPTATTGPFCLTANPGDSIFSLLAKGGYNNFSPPLVQAFRDVNNMPENSNNIVAGEKYCVPQPTPTPTPPGYEATQTQQCKELGCETKIAFVATYTIKEGDTITSLQLELGVTLRQLCELNHPDPINCGGCDIDKPIGQQNCRPVLRTGDVIRIPGPTPTPTITPTLTGSETATPTPPYSGPRLVEPVNGAALAGGVMLRWLPVGILQPDEAYLVLLSDATAQPPHTWEFETQATSLRLPADIQPTDGQPHTFNWQVMAARKTPDGAYVVVGRKSVIYTFTLQNQ